MSASDPTSPQRPGVPSPSELLALIETGAMTSDRARLLARLRELRDASANGSAARAATREADIAKLVDQVRRSVSRREERFAARPRPNWKASAGLPIAARREEIAAAIEKHQVIVLCGETGSGKTTQLPQICVEMGRGCAGLIGHTQPRRIAARTVAQRIAEELGTAPGPRGAVGIKVRFGDDSGEANYIKLMTDGILLAETQGDPSLEAYDTIIIDEAHERSLNIDFLLGYLKQLLPRRPDLKIIITSATIDTARLSNHFGGPSVCPVIEVSGRTYPVEVRYRPTTDIEADDWENVEELAILDAVDELSREGRGDILIFLPGEREIRNTAEALRKHHVPGGGGGGMGVEVLPLYARLSPAEQMRVFQPSKNGPRRIVLATNVAETSLTVPGIRYVVDAGLARISRYNHRSKVQRLPIEAISQASANQRSGRCGRVAAGIAIRLYSEDDFKQRPAFTEPEILRTNLASVILQMKSLRLGPVEEFPFVEPPDSRMIRDGYETLEELGAINERGELTALGKQLAKIPVDPRIGRILLAAADEQCLAEALVICSALEVQDPRDRPMEKQAATDQAQARFKHEQSDFLVFLNIWDAYHEQLEHLTHSKLRGWCRDHFLNFMRMREWAETYHQLKAIVGDLGLKTSDKPAAYDQVHRALLTGLLSNVCCKNEAGGGFDYNGPRGTKVSIFPGSALFKKGPKWFVAAEIVQTTKLYARTIAKVEPEWIERLAGHVVKRSYADPHWQRETGQVCAWERVVLFGLVLVPRRRANFALVDAKQAREIFIHHALIEGDWPEQHEEYEFERANAAVIEQVARLEAKLRKSDLLADHEARFAFFDARLPASVVSTQTFAAWFKGAAHANPRVLHMSVDDVLRGEVQSAGGASGTGIAELYPDRWGGAERVAAKATGTKPPTGLALEYAFEPGKDRDGVTLVVPLTGLSQVDAVRAQWLVPGLLKEKVLALLRTLPKQYRTQLDAGSTAQTGAGGGSGIAALAADIAGVLSFGQGSMSEALSEAVEVLRGIKIPPSAWQHNAIVDHLRMNFRVMPAAGEKGGNNDSGEPLGESRDLDELRKRFAVKAKAAFAALARAQFARDGLTSWDFGDLPERFEMAAEVTGGAGGDHADGHAGAAVVSYPALVDRGESVSLTLADSPETAAAQTHKGVRRLLAIACRGELSHRISSLPDIDAMYKWYAPIGEPAELKAALIDLVVERVFLLGQPALRDEASFEARQTACWGRLGAATIEVAAMVAKILEPRHMIAARLSGGTPRMWAASVADIREHAAYLMPKGFLRRVPLERLREYPRYVEAMRLRLAKLREDGSVRESRALAELAPHWKRFTAYVAQAAAEARAGIEEHEDVVAPAVAGTAGKKGQALPAARRAAPVVPTEAAAWAMTPGAIPADVDRYHWMLEEFRVSLFAQELGTAVPISGKRLEEAWTNIEERVKP